VAPWQEGLFALADGLSDPAREKIIVTRLEATAAKHPIGMKEICALDCRRHGGLDGPDVAVRFTNWQRSARCSVAAGLRLYVPVSGWCGGEPRIDLDQ
jgi:hypothetical protein